MNETPAPGFRLKRAFPLPQAGLLRVFYDAASHLNKICSKLFWGLGVARSKLNIDECGDRYLSFCSGLTSICYDASANHTASSSVVPQAFPDHGYATGGGSMSLYGLIAFLIVPVYERILTA